MSVIPDLSPEGDEAEAQELIRRHPVEIPRYKLERVHVAVLNVDYAPPHGNGYARPLSQIRLARLRREWDPLAVSPLVISRRAHDQLFVIDGNHRRVIAFEKGMLQLPAMVHSGIDRIREADLYTKLGTVLGQTPATRFASKLVAGDSNARAITEIVSRFDLTIASGRQTSHEIKAVARCEQIYARGGDEALDWILQLLTTAFPDDPGALIEMILEGAFGFWYRYRDQVDQLQLARILGGAGLAALHDRADATYAKIDLGLRANTYGVAMAEMWTASTKKRLPRWERIQIIPALHEGLRGERGQYISKVAGTHQYRPAAVPAPQQLHDTA